MERMRTEQQPSRSAAAHWSARAFPDLPLLRDRLQEVFAPGLLLRAAIELFTPRFLRVPVVLAIAESRRRLAFEDAAQLARIGLVADPRVMPDLLLADLDGRDGQLRVVFLECVATGGVMTDERMGALRAWLMANNLGGVQSAFGSVFLDRSEQVYRRLVGTVAWGSFVWFASEPEHLLAMYQGGAYEPTETLDRLAH